MGTIYIREPPIMWVLICHLISQLRGSYLCETVIIGMLPLHRVAAALRNQ